MADTDPLAALLHRAVCGEDTPDGRTHHGFRFDPQGILSDCRYLASIAAGVTLQPAPMQPCCADTLGMPVPCQHPPLQPAPDDTLREALDVERWAWAEHLVLEHGAYGSDTATPCYHRRGETGNVERVRLVAREYAALDTAKEEEPEMTCTCSTADDRRDWPHDDTCALFAPVLLADLVRGTTFMAEVEPCELTHARGTTHYHVMRPRAKARAALDTAKEAKNG